MINTATDEGLKRRFKVLHSGSVVVTPTQIAVAAYVVTRIAQL